MQEYTYQKKQFGTDVVLSLVMKEEVLAQKIAQEAFMLLEGFESRFSRFLPTSELSMLNAQRSLVVSVDFLEVLQKSYALYQETTGLFNPLLQVSRLGYTKDFSEISTTPNIVAETTYNRDFAAVQIDPASRLVTLAPNQMLDFGGILKGYLAEKLAMQIRKKHPSCQGVIVNLGGDIFASGYDEELKPFVLEVYNPITGQSHSVTVPDGALVTSGTYKRKWQTSQGIKNHIVGEDGDSSEATTIVSASVWGPHGTNAEAYAKALLLTGTEFQCPYHYLLITNNGDVISNQL